MGETLWWALLFVGALVLVRRHLLAVPRRLGRWRGARVRALQWGGRELRPYHITFTPHFGFSFPVSRRQRLRAAGHHGVQLVSWRGNRWLVTKQLAGRSRVVGERFAAHSTKER